MAFLSYYFHWSNEEVLGMDHLERRRWCQQLSKINQKLSGSEKNSNSNSIPFTAEAMKNFNFNMR